MIPLLFIKDSTGRNSGEGGFRWPSQVDFLLLAAHTAATLTVPTGAKFVFVSRTANFFMSYTITALSSLVYQVDSVSNGVCAGDAAELNPTGRSLAGCTGLSVIAPAGASLTFAWFG